MQLNLICGDDEAGSPKKFADAPSSIWRQY
jgi:hypothetical protein